MKKFIVILIIALAIAFGAYYLRHKKSTTKADAPQLDTVKIERGSISLIVSSTGRVVANLDVKIKCKASGEVVRLPYDVSDLVKKGDLLVQLDPVDEERIVKQAEVSLSASRARLAKARLNLHIAEENLATDRKRADAALKSTQARANDTRTKAKRTKKLLKNKLASREGYETAETAAIQAAAELENARLRIEELKIEELALDLKRQDVLLAEAQVESDRIALSIVQQRLTDTKVFAPIDGVVTARDVQIGQIISSGISNVAGGTTAMTLLDLSRLFILASVDESDIGKIELDQQAIITADAFRGKRFSGKVVRIATQGVNTSNVVTFEVKIEVFGQNKSLLKPEMTANVEIIAAQKDDVPLVPVESVYRKHGKHLALIVKEDGGTEERPVEVGISNDVNLEVISGLSEGETIAVFKGESESRWRSDRKKFPPPHMIFGGRRGK